MTVSKGTSSKGNNGRLPYTSDIEPRELGKGTLQYDPSHYLVPGTDHKGHSTRVFCKVRPDVDHEIDAIVGSHYWPFRVKGDFIRWAIWEGVKQITKHKPVPGSMIVVSEMIMETCRSAEIWLKFKTSIDMAEQTVKAFVDSGNEQEAIKLLTKLRGEVVKLEEAQWRDQYLDEFDKRFGNLWERANKRAVSLASLVSKGTGVGTGTGTDKGRQ
jgi:hypothetical protein